MSVNVYVINSQHNGMPFDIQIDDTNNRRVSLQGPQAQQLLREKIQQGFFVNVLLAPEVRQPELSATNEPRIDPSRITPLQPRFPLTGEDIYTRLHYLYTAPIGLCKDLVGQNSALVGWCDLAAKTGGVLLDRTDNFSNLNWQTLGPEGTAGDIFTSLIEDKLIEKSFKTLFSTLLKTNAVIGTVGVFVGQEVTGWVVDQVIPFDSIVKIVKEVPENTKRIWNATLRGAMIQEAARESDRAALREVINLVGKGLGNVTDAMREGAGLQVQTENAESQAERDAAWLLGRGVRMVWNATMKGAEMQAQVEEVERATEREVFKLGGEFLAKIKNLGLQLFQGQDRNTQPSAGQSVNLSNTQIPMNRSANTGPNETTSTSINQQSKIKPPIFTWKPGTSIEAISQEIENYFASGQAERDYQSFGNSPTPGAQAFTDFIRNNVTISWGNEPTRPSRPDGTLVTVLATLVERQMVAKFAKIALNGTLGHTHQQVKAKFLAICASLNRVGELEYNIKFVGRSKKTKERLSREKAKEYQKFDQLFGEMMNLAGLKVPSPSTPANSLPGINRQGGSLFGKGGPVHYPQLFDPDRSGRNTMFASMSHGQNSMDLDEQATEDVEFDLTGPIFSNDPNFNCEQGPGGENYQFLDEGIPDNASVIPNISPELIDFFQEMKTAFPEMGEGIREMIMDMRGLKAKGKSIDSFQFNIDVAKKCLEHLEISELSNEESAPLAHRIGCFLAKSLNKQVVSLAYFDEHVTIDNQFAHSLKGLSLQMQATNKEINANLNVIQNDVYRSMEVIQVMGASIDDLQEQMYQVRDELSQIKGVQSDMKVITDNLFKQMTTISVAGFQRCREINVEYQALEKLKSEHPENRKAILAQTEALKDRIAEEERTRAKFDYVLEGTRGCFNLAAMIAARQHWDPKLVKVLKAADPLFTISKELAGIIGFGTAAASGGLLFPLLAMAGAAYTLIELYNETDQPDPNKILWDGIQQLSSQVAQFRKETLYGFQHIEALIQGSHTNMHQRFDLLEAKLDGVYLQVMNRFLLLETNIDFLHEKFQHVDIHLQRLERKLQEGQKEIFIQTYLNTKNEVLTFHRDNTSSTDKFRDTKLHKYARRFLKFALVDSKSSILSGSHNDANQLPSSQRELQNTAPEHKIKLLTQYAANHGIKAAENAYDLVNPLFWAEGATIWMEFINATPEFGNLTGEHYKSIDELINAGILVEQFLIDLKTNEQFFGGLIDRYRRRWERLMEGVKLLVIAEYDGGPTTNEQKLTHLKIRLLANSPLHLRAQAKEQMIRQLVAENELLAERYQETSRGLREDLNEREARRGERVMALVAQKEEAINLRGVGSWFGENTLVDSLALRDLFQAVLLHADSEYFRGIIAERGGRATVNYLEQSQQRDARIAHKREKLAIAVREANEKERLTDEEALLEYIDQLAEPQLRRLNDRLRVEAVNGVLAGHLVELDAYHKLLNAFLSLGFRKDYIGDINVKGWLGKLWCQSNFTAYLDHYNPAVKESFIFSHAILKQKFTDQIEHFKQFVLEKKVIPAQIANNKKTLKADHPLVDNVIEKLEQFKMFMFKDAKRIPRPSHNNSPKKPDSIPSFYSKKRKANSEENVTPNSANKRPRTEGTAGKGQIPYGLVNIGNSCYLNATLQILLNIPDIRDLISRKPKQNNNFLQALYDLNACNTSPTSDMLRRLRTETFEKRGPGELTGPIWEQHDAHEFLLLILNQLGWKPLKTQTCFVAGPRDEIKNYGPLQATNHISLDIKGTSFQEIIDNYSFLEQKNEPKTLEVDGITREYNTWKMATDQIKEHPPYLFVQLKRFHRFNWQTIKDSRRIEFPANQQVQVSGKNYEIVGYLNHIGLSPRTGHYTADVKNSNGTWHHCNDNYPVTIRQFSECGEEAYIVLLKQL